MGRHDKKKEKKPAPSAANDSSEDEQYQVEVITKARVTDDCNWEYYVKWGGFGEDANSWEPYENVSSCDRLLKSFWDNIGSDNDDYQPGYEVSASREWVAREKRYFLYNLAAEPAPKKPQQTIAFTIRASEAGGNKKVARKPIVGDPDSSESETETLRKNKRMKKLPDSDDSDTQPLRKTRKVARDTGKVHPKASSSKASASFSSTQKRSEAASSSSKNLNAVPAPSEKRQSSSIVNVDSSSKGKERAATPPSAEPIEQTSPHSLFSAPSSPESPLRLLPADSAAPPHQATDAAPSPVEVVPPKSNLPAHVQRKVNPKIKMLDIPSSTQIAAKGILAKQRIVMTAATISPIMTSAPQLPNQAEKKRALALPNFTKKKASTQDSHSPLSPQIPSAGPSSLPSEYGRPYSTTLSDAEIVQSPVDDYMHVDNDFSYKPQLPRTNTKPFPRRPPGPDLEAQADNFLAGIMPNALSAPISEDAALKETPRAALGPPVIPSGRIQKKYKWEGELFVDSPQGDRRYCKVTMNEPSEPRPLGLPLRICLLNVESIKLGKLYNISDLYTILPACDAVTQFCKLIPQSEEDKAPLKSLETHMKKRCLFTFATAYLDDKPSGLFIVFPPAFADLCKLFRMPLNLRTQDGLVVALCPYELSLDKLEKLDWMETKFEDFRPQGPYRDPAYSDVTPLPSRKLIVGNPLYQRGLRMLKFPKRLHDFMSHADRPYCVWYGQSSTGAITKPPTDIETVYLQTILSHCGAPNVGLKTDVRVIFIHIGALSTMWKIPSMWARRNKRPELRFFTYGTHESVSPLRWGIKEVYPTGGIVTFTSKAIMEDIFGVCKLIDMLEKHPLWTCFIPPAVIGAVAKLTSSGSDPIKLLDQDECFCARLLTLIEDGKVSLLTAPPQTRRPKQTEDKAGWTDLEVMWVDGQLSLLPMTERGILDACMRAFNSLYGDTPESELHSRAGMHAMYQMDKMQFQPVLMDEYRRYVVLKGSTEDLADKADLLEVTALSAFDFKDEFFADPESKQRKASLETTKA